MFELCPGLQHLQQLGGLVRLILKSGLRGLGLEALGFRREGPHFDIYLGPGVDGPSAEFLRENTAGIRSSSAFSMSWAFAGQLRRGIVTKSPETGSTGSAHSSSKGNGAFFSKLGGFKLDDRRVGRRAFTMEYPVKARIVNA